RLQRGRDDIRVKVRYTADERSRVSGLEKVRIRTQDGHEVPLFSVADVSLSPGFSTITRTDGLRRVAVSADVDSHKANANEIFAELVKNYFPDMQNKYPDVHVALQGEQKKMRESFSSLYVGFPLAVLGIFVIVATMFRSYMQPFVIMFTIPFGLIGSILGHLFLGYDLSIMSIFGMVALTGVVVNDAIVLIERINENLAEGLLTPMIMETNMQAKFLIPMALSLAAGVAFATVLTLVLIPSLLVILNDFRMIVFRFKYGRWPTSREEVEPARTRHHNPMEAKAAATGELTTV
ncbi:MAG: efflux RND transporter permease subunit, partial [Deltaproteobacteria bacterium]|nr:efflux RND transporter permease subunit [Deltaproteobacteria bacterium]